MIVTTNKSISTSFEGGSGGLPPPTSTGSAIPRQASRPRVITFDLEIAREVENGDWTAARTGALGLSALCLYDTRTERYHVYDALTLDDAVRHLELADLVVGFNSREFDKPCIEGIIGRRLELGAHCDLLAEVWRRVGRKKGYKLSQICERTLGLEKNGSGASAPQLYAEGRYAELFDYCLNDVHITRMLYNHIIDHKYIIDVDGFELPFEMNYELHA